MMRNFYCSILWQKGDILLVDNRKVAHTGMPGSGPRLVRALISNPLQMKYSHAQPGCLHCQDSPKQSIGHYMGVEKKKFSRSKELIRLRLSTEDEFALWVKHLFEQKQGSAAEIAANGILVLLSVTCALLDRHIKAQADSFQRDGGFTKNFTA